MRTAVSESNSMEKCPDKIVDRIESKDCNKNGLVNGLVYNKNLKINQNNSGDVSLHAEIISDIKDLSHSDSIENHTESSQGSVVNNVGKSKKKTKKKKHKPHINSNDNLNKSNIEEISYKNGHSVETKLISDKLNNESDTINSFAENSISSTSSQPNHDNTCIGIENLTISDDKTVLSKTDQPDKKIDFVPYESELQMPMIMKIIQKDLSEPYSIYTYRYFIHNWPKLCFLAMCDGHCVGAIVCKLDLHRKVVRRGYIAMLAVDQNYRKLRIGSTLVQMAIHEMTNGDADEVVLETEVTNKPALKLYEKLGFVRDKRLFRYYLNGVDALRLKLWLR
ncbi:hypothetical protein ABEB36_004100 [Hypothenemus hampei]|uniref:N-terminal methionine N(alpha)-acetyltransferase NatC n=1 Tax=Hypothenemus hampei TaxID=57062 RepID=A0ABD1F5X5_HYPHA